MTFDQLQLAPLMRQCAGDLLAAFPDVVFTSGRRDLEQQAHAMACNVVVNRSFIQRTYLHAAALQSAVDLHPDARTVEQVQDVLYGALLGMSSSDLAHVSDHLTGDAVDLRPMEVNGAPTPHGLDVINWIRACPDTKSFLVREAGLVRWHWSVAPSIVTTVKET